VQQRHRRTAKKSRTLPGVANQPQEITQQCMTPAPVTLQRYPETPLRDAARSSNLPTLLPPQPNGRQAKRSAECPIDASCRSIHRADIHELDGLRSHLRCDQMST
jgi:hypothetical protein